MRARWATPMTITSVPPTRCQRRPVDSSPPWARWPVTTVKCGGDARWVTGTPAALAPRARDDTPGTTCTAYRRRPATKASSPPRPNTNGSPPFNRTTRLALLTKLNEQCGDQLLRHPATVDVCQRRSVRRRAGRAPAPARRPARVVDDDVGVGQEPSGSEGQQLGVTWPAPTSATDPPAGWRGERALTPSPRRGDDARSAPGAGWSGDRRRRDRTSHRTGLTRLAGPRVLGRHRCQQRRASPRGTSARRRTPRRSSPALPPT